MLPGINNPDKEYTTMDYLTLTWSTSKAVDTYGYNRLTLRAGGGYSTVTCGGGYDMNGTVIGDWLQDTYQDRLRAIASRASASWSRTAGYVSKPHRWEGRAEDILYGMSVCTDDGRVSLDGACGMRSMELIAEAIGVQLRSTVDRKGNATGYMVTDAQQVAA
jgi:hypothetical protein